MKKILLALAFAGVSQAGTISGVLTADAQSLPPGPNVRATDSFSANLVVTNGPDSAYIVLDAVIRGNLEYNGGSPRWGTANVDTLLGSTSSIPQFNYLPSPACYIVGSCGSGNELERVAYLYQRGVPFPFSITLRVDSYFGATANAFVPYFFRFAVPDGPSRREIFGVDVEVASMPAVNNPEPATFFTAGAMLLVLLTRFFKAKRKLSAW